MKRFYDAKIITRCLSAPYLFYESEMAICKLLVSFSKLTGVREFFENALSQHSTQGLYCSNKIVGDEIRSSF